MKYMLFLEGEQGLITLREFMKHTREITVVIPEGFDTSEIQALAHNSQLETIVRQKGVPVTVSNYSIDVIVSSQFQFKIFKSEYELARVAAVNIHAAQLPKYKGKHGGTWALINDESCVGVSTHQINERFDDGKVLHIKKIRVNDNLSLQEINRMLYAAIPEIVLSIFNGHIFNKKENIEGPSIYWRARVPEDSRINWHMSARKVCVFVRALSRPPIYGYSNYDGIRYSFQKIRLTNITQTGLPGLVVEIKKELHIVCGDGFLVKPELTEHTRQVLTPGMVLH